MAEITFVLPNGTESRVPVELGQSVMQHAKSVGIPGIDADCGGECMCATCHVHVHPDWFDLLPQAAELENDMLGISEDLKPTSRLSCQIKVTEELDGLIVNVPATFR